MKRPKEKELYPPVSPHLNPLPSKGEETDSSTAGIEIRITISPKGV